MREPIDLLSQVLAGEAFDGGAVLFSGGPAEAYRASEYLTATPPRLAELLYDAATGLCEQAVEALDAGELDSAADRLARARRLVGRLQRSLGPDEGGGGEMVRLRRFCQDVHARLIEADHYRRREAVIETISILAYERPGWLAAVRRADRADRLPARPAGAGWIG